MHGSQSGVNKAGPRVGQWPVAWVAPLALTLALAAPAAADPFGPASPIAGLGDEPGRAEISGAALTAGAAAIAVASDDGGARRAGLAFGDTAARVHNFGRPGAFDLALAANASGDVALTFTVGHVAYLTTCHRGACRPTVRVGSAPAKPQSAVAVQPGTGRTTVIWRGDKRLQWRITTHGKLGPAHTLRELGDRPQLATDDSGKTIAVWLGERSGVRTAARRAGEFP